MPRFYVEGCQDAQTGITIMGEDVNHIKNVLRLTIGDTITVCADLEKSIRVKSRNELIADVLYNYFSEGKAGQLQGVVFCVNTNHAQEMERVLNANGLSAKAYTRKTTGTEEHFFQSHS